MEKKLDIKNLRVSFRTNDGTVKAVRDINLELNKGETLAIVGESGSGKSVTAKAIMGILAPNSIVESGEIIYDGKDLLKITEEEYHDYRGNKLSMIFQDPMSSLNPIMRIGKQLTEAMILNGKSNQKTAKKDFDSKIKLLTESMKLAGVSNVDEQIKEFNHFSHEGNVLEKKYNIAYNNARDLVDELEDIIIDVPTGAPKQMCEQIKYLIPQMNKTYDDFVVRKENSKLPGKIQELASFIKTYKNEKSNDNSQVLVNILTDIKNLLTEATSYEKPDFFAMGYYISKNSGADLHKESVQALNKIMKKYLYDNFLNNFISLAQKGIEYSYNRSLKAKKDAIEVLKSNLHVYEKENLDKNECQNAAKLMISAVENSLDHLVIRKDSMAFTFNTSLIYAINTYFKGIPENIKNTKKYEKEKAKVDKLAAKGKDTHKVTPAVIVDLDLVKSNIRQIIANLLNSYKAQIESIEKIDYKAQTEEMIEYLRYKSSAVVYRVTKTMAKNKAIKLMNEVGIPQARKRYTQYPFQFSGGMRQRIVIAIALAANPDILICDEPTTALDVTIQAQILELINNLKRERQLSVIFITHDLGVVANMADKIAVMYAGKVVEYGTADDIFYSPAHPYTWALLASIPDLDTKEKLDAIPGTPPNMIHPPVGDAFAARNKYAMQIDFEQQPPMFEISPTHKAATWLLHPNAPKVEPPKIVTDRIRRMKNMEVASNE